MSVSRSVGRKCVVGGSGLALLLAAACSSNDDCASTHTCVPASAGTAGTSGGGSGAAGGTSGGGTSGGGTGASTGTGGQGGDGTGGCQGDVSEDAACWTTNELGVFVSSETGSDEAGNGTKEAPFATVGKGIAASGGKNIYVCLGATKDTYNEPLSIGAEQDGLRLYGGFDCVDWSYSTTRKALVKSPNAIGVRIASLQEGAVIENLRIEASTATNAGESSYGAFIVDSKNVVLRRVEITAGDGAKGADGEAGLAGTNGTKSGEDQEGDAALCAVDVVDGSGGEPIADAFGSRGGKGGDGAVGTVGDAGRPGIPASNVKVPDLANGGPAATGTEVGGNGLEGSEGNSGTLGAAAEPAGTFEQAGYKPANGNDGGNGYPGQGGGGGGASKGAAGCRGASGGAGGMGGGGGGAGKGGQGGGASVGLFAWQSNVLLKSAIVVSSSGGMGGNGGQGGGGGAGMQGGAGGAGDTLQGIKKGGLGGAGAVGGNGGSGSGGTGGGSYALVFGGPRPEIDVESQLLSGDGGAAGLGGKILDDVAPDGAEGLSVPELDVQ